MEFKNINELQVNNIKGTIERLNLNELEELKKYLDKAIKTFKDNHRNEIRLGDTIKFYDENDMLKVGVVIKILNLKYVVKDILNVEYNVDPKDTQLLLKGMRD